MSATGTDDAINAVLHSDVEQFRSRKPPSEPLTTKGHKIGVHASPKDAVPEFNAETRPPGTAPEENTFRPAPTNEFPPIANYTPDVDPESTITHASDTLGGASSADVDKGLGHPIHGQTSAELRHDGMHGRIRQRAGLEKVGAGGPDKRLPGDRVPGMEPSRGTGINAHSPSQANQRALDRDEAQVGEAGGVTGRGDVGGPPAEDRLPESAETVAREAPGGT